MPTEDVVDVLTRLVDRSLVVADGSGRLTMLETVREYAAERLAEAGRRTSELAGPAPAHAAYFAEFAADVGERFSDSPTPEHAGPARRRGRQPDARALTQAAAEADDDRLRPAGRRDPELLVLHRPGGPG